MKANQFRKKLASFVCLFIPHKRTRSFVREFIEKPDIKNRWQRVVQGRMMKRDEKCRVRKNVKFPFDLSL